MIATHRGLWGTVALQVAIAVVGLVFFAAAMAKAMSPSSLVASVAWLGISADFYLPVLLGVVIVECALGLCLILWPRSSVICWVATALLVGYTILLGSMLVSSHPPDCNCLGKLLQFRTEQQALLFGIGRNAAMTGALLVTQISLIRKPGYQ